MPPKKDGQPPPKPKPEELISEFKDKFEVFSTETKKGFEEYPSLQLVNEVMLWLLGARPLLERDRVTTSHSTALLPWSIEPRLDPKKKFSC